jgi:hypothetical protein
MKRQVNNLLFMFAFLFALQVGSTNYVQYGLSVLDHINFRLALSKTHREEKKLAEQNSYNKALPSDVWVNAHQSFMDGKSINLNVATERVVGGLVNSAGAIITATTNHGRDGP